jgi:hypothetical protein
LVTGRFWPVSDHRAIADEPLFHTSVCSAISRAPLKCVIRLSHSTCASKLDVASHVSKLDRIRGHS